MILSNVQILERIQAGDFHITDLAGSDPRRAPFNTSAVDLRLADQITVPASGGPFQLDLSGGGIAQHLAKNSTPYVITDRQPFSLTQNQLILARTRETVSFPLRGEGTCYSARVEGKSSLARCGVLVHFTAPTIHAGFSGSITLEIINLGPQAVLLTQGMYICQLIIEEVAGYPADAPNRFRGQTTPAGV